MAGFREMEWIARIAARLRGLMGPLQWGILVVSIWSRFGDFIHLVTRFVMGKQMKSIDFGGVDPVYTMLTVIVFPVAVLSQSAASTISRLESNGKHAEVRGLLRLLLSGSLLFGVVVCVALYFMRDFVFLRLHIDASNLLLWTLMALLLVSIMEPFYSGMLQGGMRYRAMGIPSIVTPLLYIVGVYFLTGTVGLGLGGVMVARVVAGGVTVVAVLFALRSMLSGASAFDKEEWRHLSRMLIPMGIFQLATLGLMGFDRLYVRNFLVADSGGYGAVASLGLIPFYLTNSVAFVVFPLASAEYASGRQTSKHLRQSVWIGMAITAMCAVMFAFSSQFLFSHWNTDFVPYAGFVWSYALMAGLHGIIQVVASVEMARHRYEFLWWMLVPTLAMCGVLYVYRATTSIEMVLTSGIAARSIVLVGFWLLLRGRENDAMVQRA